MAFVRSDLGQDSASDNRATPREWVYTTADTQATVNTAGYFNNAADLLQVGDRITAVTDTGGTPSYDVYFVNANSGGVVDVDDGTAIDGGTDTD